MPTFTKRSAFPAPVEELFGWHRRSGALERLTPPWERVDVVERNGGIENGGRVRTRVKFGPFRLPWISEHHDYEKNVQFRDTMLVGPFRSFVHSHRFFPGSELEDQIDYELPLGGFIAAGAIARKLQRGFDYRHALTRSDLARHATFADRPRLRIAITGASGLVGRALWAFLTTGGHSVDQLKRDALTPAALEGVDVVVNLAGESIAGKRWDELQKWEIVHSRVNLTQRLVAAMLAMPTPPKLLISASATGVYGSRGDELLTEASSTGTDFLGDLCNRWEVATDPAQHRGIRVVNLRLGVVLTAAGGAMDKLLTPFKLGVGGVLGGGRQYMSWIGLDDLVYAVHHAIFTETLSGPVLAVSPTAPTNREFTKTLGRVLWRPTIVPMPAFAMRMAFGEVADAALLASQRCAPTKLLGSGFQFTHPELEQTVRWTLGR